MFHCLTSNQTILHQVCVLILEITWYDVISWQYILNLNFCKIEKKSASAYCIMLKKLTVPCLKIWKNLLQDIFARAGFLISSSTSKFVIFVIYYQHRIFSSVWTKVSYLYYPLYRPGIVPWSVTRHTATLQLVQTASCPVHTTSKHLTTIKGQRGRLTTVMRSSTVAVATSTTLGETCLFSPRRPYATHWK